MESYPSLIGGCKPVNDEETPAAAAAMPAAPESNAKKDLSKIRRWMIVLGTGHLLGSAGNSGNLADPRKFTHLCTSLMDKIEQRHGSKLRPIVRQIVAGRQQTRLDIHFTPGQFEPRTFLT